MVSLRVYEPKSAKTTDVAVRLVSIASLGLSEPRISMINNHSCMFKVIWPGVVKPVQALLRAFSVPCPLPSFKKPQRLTFANISRLIRGSLRSSW